MILDDKHGVVDAAGNPDQARRMSQPRSKFRTLAFFLLATASLPAWTAIQSDAASRQSESSMAASVEVPIAVTHALSEGAAFVVTAVDASADAARGSPAGFWG